MGSETSGFLARMAAQAAAQKTIYDHIPVPPPQTATVSTPTCPGCGAGLAKMDGLTRCGYCGYQFIAQQLTDGTHISSSDNSDHDPDPRRP
ncbi:MAG: hypothetical protein FWH11_02975 [Micrococcales bacterium]|nr:hypothetical protein [Micrococcales bacterium]